MLGINRKASEVGGWMRMKDLHVAEDLRRISRNLIEIKTPFTIAEPVKGLISFEKVFFSFLRVLMNTSHDPGQEA